MDYPLKIDNDLKVVLRLLKEYYKKDDTFVCIPTLILEKCIRILELTISLKEDRYDYLR